jgi:hypothetical protein
MTDVIIDFISDYILNYIGGFVRFIFGRSYRIIFNMKTYSFDECLSGPKEEGLNYISHDNPHKRSNVFIGLVFIIIFFFLIYLILC